MMGNIKIKIQICFYFPFLKNSQSRTLFGNMYSSFFDALRRSGVGVTCATEIDAIKGDVLVVVIGGGYEPLAAKAMHAYQEPIILYVHNTYLSFYKSFLKRWQSRILFAYNPDYATLNYQKYNSVQIPYYHFPFGSDKQIFYPMNLAKKYDIAFLGNANSGFGRDRYIQPLVKYIRKNNLKIFLAGSGWEKFGFPYQIVENGTQTNEIYNSSKICINIHNDRQYLGIDKEMDANNRLFDLAMAQCCQISNGEKMIRKYFEPTEVIAVDDPQKWINKIDEYLNNPEARRAIAVNARSRALKDHQWDSRANDFIQMIAENIPEWEKKDQKIGIPTHCLRYLDQYIISPYKIKDVRTGVY